MFHIYTFRLLGRNRDMFVDDSDTDSDDEDFQAGASDNNERDDDNDTDSLTGNTWVIKFEFNYHFLF